MCSELFPQSERSAIAVLDMTQVGVVGTDAAIPRLPIQNGDEDFCLAFGLCVLHNKIEIGKLCMQTKFASSTAYQLYAWDFRKATLQIFGRPVGKASDSRTIVSIAFAMPIVHGAPFRFSTNHTIACCDG